MVSLLARTTRVVLGHNHGAHSRLLVQVGPIRSLSSATRAYDCRNDAENEEDGGAPDEGLPASTHVIVGVAALGVKVVPTIAGPIAVINVAI